MKKLCVAILLVLAASPVFAAGPSCKEADLIGLGMNNVLAQALGCDSYATDLLPETDDTYDLGSSTYKWQDLYIDGTIYADAIDSATCTALSADINFTSAGLAIHDDSGTSAGDLALCIEDTCDATTGSAVHIHGISDVTAGEQGLLDLLSGNVNDADADIHLTTGHAAGDIEFSNPSGVEWWIDSTQGDLLQGAQGGDIVMAQTDEGLIVGAASINADVAYAALYTFGTRGLAIAQGVDDANDSHLAFYKSDATDGSADTAADSGDDLGSIDFYGADGNTFALAAQILVEAAAATGDGDMAGKITFLVSPDGSETPAAALTIDQDKSLTFAGTLISSSTSTIGWHYKTGANTACDTTCTAGSVFGVDLAAGASAPVIVNHDDATADACICAGAA